MYGLQQQMTCNLMLRRRASTIKIVFNPALLYNLISSNACSDLHRLKLPLSICIALGHSLSRSSAKVLASQFTNGMV